MCTDLGVASDSIAYRFGSKNGTGVGIPFFLPAVSVNRTSQRVYTVSESITFPLIVYRFGSEKIVFNLMIIKDNILLRCC